MATKHYAIYNPATKLYSAGFPTTYQQQIWVSLDEAHMWISIHAVKCHIAYCRKYPRPSQGTPYPVYVAPMEIVEIERVYTNKGLAEKI